MVSKKTYLFALLAILNACVPSNQITILPSANPITNSSPTVITSSPTPTPTMITVSTPSPIPTATAKPNLSTLSVGELKQINDSSIVKSNNTFGINLYKDIVEEQKDENIFISPASLALALQMTYNGAESNTKDEMTKALELGTLSLDQVNNLSKLLIKKLNSPDPDIQLQVANSLWGGKGRISFLDDFKNNLKNYYNAESSELDFSDPKSVDTINSWASKNTNGKIPKVIEEITPENISFIMNAVYFKANWASKFDVKQTQKRDFTLADGSKKIVPMMTDFKDFRYFKNYVRYPEILDPSLGFEAAELSYGKDGKVSLYIFLPSIDSSLEKFYSQLNEENLEKWLKGFYYNQGYISFPKFKNEWKKKLNDNLKNIGMKQAFAGNANFSKMGTAGGNIYIDFVLHNTFIDVNEEGSEAAAVTIIGNNAGSSAPTLRFVADRPFFYMIRDNETKSILFMGSVNDPKYD